MFTVC